MKTLSMRSRECTQKQEEKLGNSLFNTTRFDNTQECLYFYISISELFRESPLVAASREMLMRLWTTVKALRELNRTAPETLARARALQAQQREQLEQNAQARTALADKLADTILKGMENLNVKQQAEMAQRLQAFEARLNAVQLDHAKIQSKALSNIADDFEATLLKVGGAGAMPGERGGAAAVKPAVPAADASGSGRGSGGD